MAQMNQRELRIVLLGATGAGKSATGNSLLRKEAFEESEDPQAGTAVSLTGELNNIIPGYKISVTDTPGLHSTSSDQALICVQVMQFIGQISPGPHVIVIVVSAGQRVSKEIQATIETFTSMFGEDSTKHMMFLFTKTDLLTTRFKTQATPIEDWIEQLCDRDEEFRNNFNKCGRRYASINNRLLFDSDAYKQQIARIMDTFISLVRGNGGLYHTNEDYNVIENLLKELDKQTADRSESRQTLTSYLMAVGSGVTGGAALGTAGAVAGSAGAILPAEVAVGALGGAVLGGGIAAAGSVAIAGISLAGWAIYKLYRKMFAKAVSDKISKRR